MLATINSEAVHTAMSARVCRVWDCTVTASCTEHEEWQTEGEGNPYCSRDPLSFSSPPCTYT